MFAQDIKNNVSLGDYHKPMPIICLLVDGIIILFCLYAISAWDQYWSTRYWPVGLLGCGLYYFFGFTAGTFSNWRNIVLGRELVRLSGIWSYVVITLMLIAFAAKASDEYSRVVIISWFITTPAFIFLWHTFIYFNPKAFDSSKKVRAVIIGMDAGGLEFAKEVNSAPGSNIEIIGFYDDSFMSQSCPQTKLPLLGSFNLACQDGDDRKFDLAYINIDKDNYELSQRLISKLSNTTVSLYYILPSLMTDNLLYPQWHSVGNHYSVSLFEGPFSGQQKSIKRIEDIVLSSLILLLIAIPMMIIALIIKMTSPGPVFFIQTRYGLNGKPFRMYKFRSMTDDASKGEFKQATSGDLRITPIGHFIRKHSLDELPQFFNVIQGSMSIVGPRPHADVHNEEFRVKISGYMLRHKVTPGITGLAQISGCRGVTDTPDKMLQRVTFDLAYIRSWSLYLDFKIIFISIFKGFFGGV
ncbi:MAG: undecaprenyl-phosphate glucose phosphotransferase [Planctomycetes bacterium]|nr:undecaprenyl-phosphate glucose phosphotransferase [Planctomycetota bacterium]